MFRLCQDKDIWFELCAVGNFFVMDEQSKGNAACL